MTITRKHVLWVLVALCLAWPALVGGWAGSTDWSNDTQGYGAGGVAFYFIAGWFFLAVPTLIVAAIQRDRARTTIAVLLVVFGPLTVLAVSALAVAL